MRKKVFVKKPFFVETAKKTIVLKSKGDFKAALDLCRSAAERKKLNFEVIGIGTRKVINNNLYSYYHFVIKNIGTLLINCSRSMYDLRHSLM